MRRFTNLISAQIQRIKRVKLIQGSDDLYDASVGNIALP